MPVDRDETLKKADKLLKQGKVAAAIQEYVRLVEDNPEDWNTANTLGDLYLKAGEQDRAVEQFTRAADHLFGEGFFPRASAVYKKVLKVRGGDDHAIWRLADIAGRNGLSLDARSYYARLIQDRRAAGNERGAVDCLVRLARLEDATVDAKRVAAQALVEHGEPTEAARLILDAANILTKEDRLPEALAALQEAARLDPGNQEIRDRLADAGAADPVAQDTIEPVDAPAPVTEVEVPTAASYPEESIDSGAGSAAPLDDSVIALEPASADPDPTAVLAEIAAMPDPEPAEALPLESFFEELRGRVAHDEEVRAREHYDRGLRHLEEEKPAEAIADLEEAARHPALRFEASARLARLCLGRGDLEASVDWMERALEGPAPAPQDRLAAMYDLADTLVRQGEMARAMAVFMELESESTGYRDVGERIARLSQTSAEIGEAVMRLLLTAFFLETGAVLVLAPWSQFWDRNYFAQGLPLIHALMINNFVRGAVSGLGIVNIGAAVAEMRAFFAERRVEPIISLNLPAAEE